MTTEPTTPRRWRPRFSLLALLLAVVFLGACGGLWWRWEPWHLSDRLPLYHAATDSDAVVLLKRSEGLYEVHDLEAGLSKPPFRLDPKLGISFLSTRDNRLLCASPDGVLSVHEFPSGKQLLTQPAPSLDRDHLIAGQWLADGGSVVLMHLDVINRMSETRDDVQSPELVAWDMNHGTWLYRLKVGYEERFAEAQLYTNCLTPILDFFPSGSREHVWLSVIDNSNLSEGAGTANYLVETRSGQATFSMEGSIPSKCTEYIRRDQKTLILRDLSRPEYVKRFDLSPTRYYPMWAWLSPDGSRLFVRIGEFCMFDVASGKLLARCAGDRDAGYHTTWDPSSTVFATHNPVSVWDGRTCSLLCRLGDGKVETERVRFMDHGRRLVTEPKQATIWDARDGSMLWKFPEERTTIRYISRTGDRIVTYKGEIWRRRRPEYWWGIAWLPEFWIALVSGTALLYLASCSFSRRFQTLK